MKKDLVNKKHIFVLYVEKLSFSMTDDVCIIKDETIVHRLNDVLRLETGDCIYIFDEKINIYGAVSLLQKKTCTIEIREKKENKNFEHQIILYLPLLKKTALEDAVYNATEMGVSEIQLIETDYSQKKIAEHEFYRLEKMVIAACEQSKRFNVPQLKLPFSFKEVIEKTDNKGLNIWFDPQGSSLFSLCSILQNSKPKKIGIFVGPEADFSKEEKKTLQKISEKYTLTPTVLRSVSAVSLSMGVIRSIL